MLQIGTQTLLDGKSIQGSRSLAHPVFFGRAQLLRFALCFALSGPPVFRVEAFPTVAILTLGKVCTPLQVEGLAALNYADTRVACMGFAAVTAFRYFLVAILD